MLLKAIDANTDEPPEIVKKSLDQETLRGKVKLFIFRGIFADKIPIAHTKFFIYSSFNEASFFEEIYVICKN